MDKRGRRPSFGEFNTLMLPDTFEERRVIIMLKERQHNDVYE